MRRGRLILQGSRIPLSTMANEKLVLGPGGESPAKAVPLDVHADASQVTAVSDDGELLFEMKTPTEREALRAVVGGVPGPKRVVFEEGPLSGMIVDALRDVCSGVVSCDPTHNALTARSEVEPAADGPSRSRSPCGSSRRGGPNVRTRRSGSSKSRALAASPRALTSARRAC